MGVAKVEGRLKKVLTFLQSGKKKEVSLTAVRIDKVTTVLKTQAHQAQ